MNNSNVIRAFGTAHVVRLTGLTEGKLRAWDNTGLFEPDYGYEDRRSPYSRIYSFRDVVALRTISVLQDKYRISTQELRRVAKKLIDRGYEHWADTKLYVLKKQVYFQEPGSRDVEGVRDGQLAMLPVIDVIQDVEDRVESLQQRTNKQIGMVEQHRHVARNTSVVAGTRIPTATIRRYREEGYSVDEIIQEYPSLTKKDVRAALKYEKEKEKVA